MIQKLRRFVSLPAKEKFLLIEAMLKIPVFRIYLMIVPFRSIAKDKKKITDSAQNETLARLIAKSLGRTPAIWTGKNRCFVLSLTGRNMLRTRKLRARIHLGVMHNEDHKLIAHAWLMHQHIEVYPKDGKFKELIEF